MIPWFLCVNDNQANQRRALVALATAKRNCPSLVRYLVYSGTDQAFMDRASRYAEIVQWRLLLGDKLTVPPEQREMAEGTYLRMDIPIIIQLLRLDGFDGTWIYTDCDVIWLKDPVLPLVTTFGVCTESFQDDKKHWNNGVLVCNQNFMLDTYDALSAHITTKGGRFPAFDQGAYNEFYMGRAQWIPNEWNWKPYWPKNGNAYLIHFHGPKPDHYTAHQSGKKIHPSLLPYFDKKLMRDSQLGHWCNEWFVEAASC